MHPALQHKKARVLFIHKYLVAPALAVAFSNSRRPMASALCVRMRWPSTVYSNTGAHCAAFFDTYMLHEQYTPCTGRRHAYTLRRRNTPVNARSQTQPQAQTPAGMPQPPSHTAPLPPTPHTRKNTPSAAPSGPGLCRAVFPQDEHAHRPNNQKQDMQHKRPLCPHYTRAPPGYARAPE